MGSVCATTQAVMRPQVVFGLPLYNGAAHLSEALESILSQTFGDFRLVMLDDGSNDGSEDIAREYCALDDRLHYEGNHRRLGMTENWRRCFNRSRELWGEAPYFAWVSDHDLWHPRWLATLKKTLDKDPGAMLAYPFSVGISDEGVEVREPWAFDTKTTHDVGKRFRQTCFEMVAGSMVYGLFRAAPLARCGVYRTILLPDRQMLMELSLHGRFVQVSEILWYRRYRTGVRASLDRQRAAFWPDGAPRSANVWWPLTHTVVLARSLMRDRNRLENLPRGRIPVVVAQHLVLSTGNDLRSRWRKRWRKRLQLLKRSRTDLEARVVSGLEAVPLLSRAAPAARVLLRMLHGTGVRVRRGKARGVLVAAGGRRVLPGASETPAQRVAEAQKRLDRLSRYKPPSYLVRDPSQ